MDPSDLHVCLDTRSAGHQSLFGGSARQLVHSFAYFQPQRGTLRLVSAQLATVAVRQLVHSSAYFQPQRGTLLFVSAQLATVAVCQLVHSSAYFKPQRGTLLVVSAQLATGDGVPLTRDAFCKDSGALLAT